MNKRLFDFLTNNEKRELRELPYLPITELTGIPFYENIKTLLDHYDIEIDIFSIIKFDTFVLWLVEYDNEARKYKWFTTYVLYGTTVFMLLYPLLISNFWLYFLLPLIPLAAYANGILKSPYKKLYWLSILGLSIYSVIFSKYELFGMIIPAFVQVKSIHKAKYFYMDTIIKSAIRNELNFKFLYYIGLIKLENKITGETYSVYKTL